VIIIAGTLRVEPGERDRYLDLVSVATALARATPGCLDFAQSADPLEADRINIFERWESDDDLAAFRALPDDGTIVPAILDASVQKYRIAAVEAP
jgi:quinol monooxygenase YgiN